MKNQPAFPVVGSTSTPGITTRTYIAIKAMQGLLTQNDKLLWDESGIADAAWRQADAMLNEEALTTEGQLEETISQQQQRIEALEKALSNMIGLHPYPSWTHVMAAKRVLKNAAT